jgi:hypothetical protein
MVSVYRVFSEINDTLYILGGKWIVSFDWISACLLHNSLQDEAPFEVRGTCEKCIYHI